MSLIDRLAARCEEGPELAALIDAGGRTWSRGRFLRRIRALSRGFIASGLQPGDRVLFAVRPDAQAAALMIAIVEAGGVVVPLDTAMGPALFSARLAAIRPRWVVAESVLLAAEASRIASRFLAWRGVELPRLAGVADAKLVRVGPRWPGVPASQSLAELERLGDRCAAAVHAAMGEEDASIIVFTSGTTEAPRAVVHSWRSMQAVFDIVGSLLDAGAGDVVYARDLHIIIPALSAGATVVVPPRSGSTTRRTLRDLDKFHVTHFFGVTAQFQQMVEQLNARGRAMPRSLREIWIGAAPVHAAFLQRLRPVLAPATRVWCVYGMTEILPVARVSLAEKLQYAGRGDLVGRCVPGVSARVSESGELMLRGPNLCSGYLGEARRDELATGDIARLDDGRIVLLGRIKDMIIRGRFNIYPELYEPTIEQIDGVSRCAMVGIFDPVAQDERVLLAVEPREGVDAAALRQRVARELRSGPFSIDVQAMPDAIHVLELPVAGRSSKIDKERLRESLQRIETCASP